MNKNIDYIIVGAGLAGLTLAHIFEENDIDYIVYENDSQNSSSIAGGLYNPVVLKRFTPIWNAKEQIEYSIPFYKKIEKKLNSNFLHELDLLRKIYSIEEQNNWYLAADKIGLKEYLNTELIKLENQYIENPFKMGKVNYTGVLQSNDYLSKSKDFLKDKIINETLEYDKIISNDNSVSYNNHTAKKIIFCEGYGVNKNPFFNNMPVDGTKGEIITIYAPKLQLKNIINSSIFIAPLENNLYRVGATYNWNDKDIIPTQEAKKELIQQVKDLIQCDFEVIKHDAGIRPTVKDRKPILGLHHENKRLVLFNGLGTRGVLFAPYLANILFNYLENNIELNIEININRIYKKLGIIIS